VNLPHTFRIQNGLQQHALSPPLFILVLGHVIIDIQKSRISNWIEHIRF